MIINVLNFIFMKQSIIPKDIDERVSCLITWTWEILAHKIENGLIEVHNEATLQLEYACLLRQGFDFIKVSTKEEFYLELEAGIEIEGKIKEVDIILKYKLDSSEKKFAIEMKFYKRETMSGTKRGARTDFMENIYQDLKRLEDFKDKNKIDFGIFLLATDYDFFTKFPTDKSKEQKKWLSYNTSDGHSTDNTKEKLVELKNSYTFNWLQIGNYYFLKL